MPRRRALRDVDASEVVGRLRLKLWAIAVGAVMGGVLGVGLAVRHGWPMLAAMCLAALAVGLAVFVTSRLLVAASGAAARVCYAPRGSSTPYQHELSHIQSLVARGDYHAAEQLYRDLVDDAGADHGPGPLLALARLYRDQLDDAERAGHYFRMARNHPGIGRGMELQLTRELIELYRDRLGRPERALPELARLAQLLKGSTRERLVREELADLKRQVVPGDSNGEGQQVL